MTYTTNSISSSQIYELLFPSTVKWVPISIGVIHLPPIQLYLTCKHVIETHYGKEHLSIQGIADDLNVHRSYLTTLSLRSFTRSLPKEFLHSVRMQRAHSYWTNTGRESIKIVAYSVGFSDPLFFQRLSRPIVNWTPSQYRSKHKI